MEKKTRTHSKTIKPVLLYLDDLEKIVDIFKEISEDVEIETEEYKFDSLEDLQNANQDMLNNLKMRISNPFDISLSLEPGRIELYSAEDSASAMGVFYNVEKILHERRRKLMSLLISPWSYFFIFISSVAVGWHFGSYRHTKMPLHLLISLIIPCLLVILGELAFYGYRKEHSIIYLKKRKDLPSFWRRNKDQIIIYAFFTLIGILGALAVTKLW